MIKEFKKLPFPIFEIDDSYQIVEANDLFLELLGIPMDSHEKIDLLSLINGGVEGENTYSIENLSSFKGEKINIFLNGGNGVVAVELSLFELDNVNLGLVYDLSSQNEKNEEYVSLREKMVKGMYQQGIAQSAIGVLHNIGNLLTIIKSNADNEQVLSELSIVSTIFKKLDDSLDGNFDKEVASKLIKTIHKSYPSKIAKIQQAFDTISETILNMDDVIKTQQKYASVDNTHVETFSVDNVIQDALNLNAERIRKRDVKVVNNIRSQFSGNFEKSGLIQVLSNLLVNALESMDSRFEVDPNYTEKIIEIDVEEESQFINIKIKDNGAGFSSELKEKLFDFGFSTKERGSGFGLHECISMLNFYGGEMTIDSQGANLGAISEVKIPKG